MSRWQAPPAEVRLLSRFLFSCRLPVVHVGEKATISLFQTLITCAAWYIPPEWLEPSEEAPRNILEAAQLAQRLASKGNRHIPYSKIPLIIHQTWKDTNLVTWKPDILEGVERWLTYATAGGDQSMAYFLWLDDGCKDLISGMQPELVDYVDAMPLMVEKSDVFRVLVVNLIGGVVGLPIASKTSVSDVLAVWRCRHAATPVTSLMA